MNALLHYDCLSMFKRIFYKDLLTNEHLESDEIRMDKLTYTDGSTEEEANLWGYVFKKDGIKYILPSRLEDGTYINLSKTLPIIAKETIKIAYRGIVYHLIKKPVSAKFRPQKKMSFKEMVDIFSSLGHDNPLHQKLLLFMALSQMMDRANFRISTPPGFGKDSSVDIMGNLIGRSSTIVSPTLAKLEFMTNYKWLAVNEIVDIPKGEWRVIEQFILDAGAFKPEIAKHSRAIAGGVKEMLDISQFSLSLLYNDINNYNEKTQYFDYVAKDAVKDRFPPFRLYGNFTEDFNSIRNIDVRTFVKDNFDKYKDLIYTFTYYKKNLYNYLHHYKTTEFDIYPERWKTNIGKLLKIIDVYCDSETEFKEWVQVIVKAIEDYQEMLKYT